MATQVQFRGGTTSEHSTFTGVAREVTVDTTKKTVVVHDGSTAGGIPLAKESAVTSAAAITGGSINGTTVGASTASTGAFTTLSASSTVSGAGFSTYLASPPAIGGTTASTGRFTTVTATGLTSGRVTYAGASGLLSDSANLTYNGTYGLTTNGVTQAYNTLLYQVDGTLSNYSASNNVYLNGNVGGGISLRGSGNGAQSIGMDGAASGVISFSTNTTERMRITSAGNVGIGTSSPSYTLDLSSTTNGIIARFKSTSTYGQVVADNSSGTGGGLFVTKQNGTNTAIFGNSGGILGTTSTDVGIYGAVAGSSINFYNDDTPTLKMTLNSSGNLGIGTTSQNERLRLNSSTAGQARMSISYQDSTISFYGSYSGIVGAGNATDTFLSAQAVLAFGSGGTTERMRIDTSGNVGIGTSSPTNKLEVVGTIYTNNGSADNLLSINGDGAIKSGVQFKANGGGPYTTIYFDNSTNNTYYKNLAAGGHLFYNGTTQAMTLDASGNLLVGTTDTTKTNTGFRVESGVANTSRGSTGSFFEFYDTGSGSRIGYISNSGGVATLYNTTSDQRLKTNIVDAPSGNIDSIKVRSFDWIVNNSHQPYGMVAQELIEVAPYAVNKPENPDEMMAVDYSKLVPMMIKEIQDLKARLLTLENK